MNMPLAADNSSDKADSAGTARLFVALWPDQGVCDELVENCNAWKWSAGATLMQPDMFHLTVRFIGPVPRNRLSQLQAEVAVPVVSFIPFVLNLDGAELWPHGIAVLRPRVTPTALLVLHGELGQALQRCGIPTEDREFRPHVTLARHAAGAVLPSSMPAINWRVKAYALAESTRAASGRYRVIRRYDV